ncbi:MAG: helix-turn-helix domain-containing protein [Firmicutes bacterium]|nr:helix-turn-helix domain-containing protein [Bacillota bacterium]
MPKKPTKACDNEFCKARIAASSCNDHLASREGASEELGIDRTRLARIELGSLNPYPEEVLIMADYYDAPELANHYCSQMCPLGKKTVLPAGMQNLDRLTIRIISALTEAGDIRDAILEIAADGVISGDERAKAQEICAALEQIAITAQEMRIWVVKNLKGGENHG